MIQSYITVYKVKGSLMVKVWLEKGREKQKHNLSIQSNAIKRWTQLRPTAMAPHLCRGRSVAKPGSYLVWWPRQRRGKWVNTFWQYYMCGKERVLDLFRASSLWALIQIEIYCLQLSSNFINTACFPPLLKESVPLNVPINVLHVHILLTRIMWCCLTLFTKQFLYCTRLLNFLCAVLYLHVFFSPSCVSQNAFSCHRHALVWQGVTRWAG